MTGPETMHRALTSGNPQTIQTLVADVDSAMTHVRGAIDDIVLAEDQPNWASPSARTQFNMNAWATRATAEMSYVRLNRTHLSLQMVAGAQTWAVTEADRQITSWRTAKAQLTSGFLLMLWRGVVMGHLEEVRTSLGISLDEARDFFQTDGLSDDERAWLENGLARSLRDDLEDPTRPIGPIIPNTFATGNDDDGWTPQGLAYDPVTGMLVQTSYNEDGEAELSVIDPETGRLVQTVQLGPYDGAAPDHAGGVNIHDGLVYVTSADTPPRLFTYDLADVQNATPGETVPVQGTPQTIDAGSYSTIHGGVMYAGTFTKDPGTPGELFTYELDPDSGRWERTGGPFETPGEAQGVAIHDGHIVFSTSEGRQNPSNLQVYDLAHLTSTGQLGTQQGYESLPNMSEGVVALPHGLLTTHESGSSSYVDPNGNPVSSLWAGTHLSFTPYADVGIDGETDVEPLTLRQASRSFRHAESALNRCETEIDRLTLPASSIADVPAAATYATALVSHFDTTADWLDEGRITADVTAAGLVQTAEDYEDTDQASGGFLGKLVDKLGLI